MYVQFFGLTVAWNNPYEAPDNVMLVEPVLGWLVRATALCIPFRESKEKTSLQVLVRVPAVIVTLRVPPTEDVTSDRIVESDIHLVVSPAVNLIDRTPE